MTSPKSHSGTGTAVIAALFSRSALTLSASHETEHKQASRQRLTGKDRDATPNGQTKLS